MPVLPTRHYPRPDYWNIYGHSFFMTTVGTLNQTGRMDAIFRQMMDVEFTNWANRAVTGAQLMVQGRSQGGYTRVFQEVAKSTRTGPYAGADGAAVICYGINDMGFQGVATQQRTAFKSALRSIISRHRASAVYENNYNLGSGAGQTLYGAGFTETTGTQDFTSGTSIHRATSTTNATITWKLPTDYQGEPVVLCFVGAAGVFGGSVTFSGTAGVTGTLSTSNIMASANHCPVIKRVTGLTSANASQTIIATVTAVDASGAVEYDCWWLEALGAPPVVVCNIPRCTTAGYASYPTWSGSQATADADVANFNSDIYSVAAEFDSMVQVADLDSAINKTTALFASDGIHPNEIGAAKCADALYDAVNNLRPTTEMDTAQLNSPAPKMGGQARPRRSNQWYTTPYRAFGANITAVAGTMYAIPMVITQPTERWIQLSVEAIASITGTAIRWGIYDDVGWTGYPQDLVVEATSAGAFTITSGTGVKVSPASGTGSLNQPLDPGLYWLTCKFTTIGVSHTFRSVAGPSDYMPNLSTTGAGGSTLYSGWSITGQGTTAFPGTFPTGAVLTDPSLMIGIKVF